LELQDLLDNLTGDIEYDPKRGAIYAAASVIALAIWALVPSERSLTAIPLVVGCGGVRLLFPSLSVSLTGGALFIVRLLIRRFLLPTRSIA
jgi:hypothetical protein